MGYEPGQNYQNYNKKFTKTNSILYFYGKHIMHQEIITTGRKCEREKHYGLENPSGKQE